jgi:hypothetical protein
LDEELGLGLASAASAVSQAVLIIGAPGIQLPKSCSALSLQFLVLFSFGKK